jgi:hypothetical protein
VYAYSNMSYEYGYMRIPPAMPMAHNPNVLARAEL